MLGNVVIVVGIFAAIICFWFFGWWALSLTPFLLVALIAVGFAR